MSSSELKGCAITLLVLVGLAGALIVALWLFMRQAEPPTLAELKQAFPSRRTDLERIVQMASQDKQIVSLNGDATSLEIGLTKARAEVYRQIFSRNQIKLGFVHKESGDLFVIVDSIGFLNKGHASGYVHCASSIDDTGRDDPCILNQAKGRFPMMFAFERLDREWFAYDEGHIRPE